MWQRALWRRALARAKDYAQKVQDGRPPIERTLYTFKTEADVALWQTFADSQYGGMSTAALQLAAQGEYAALHGDLSTDISDAAAATGGMRMLRRSGFCGMRTHGEEELDLEAFDTLEFRVRGDGRKYIATLRTDNWISLPGAAHDLWQAFLFAPAGEWANVQVPLARFLKTWRGKILDSEQEMNAAKVISVGISVAGGGVLEPAGPYRIEVQRILALNVAAQRAAAGAAG